MKTNQLLKNISTTAFALFMTLTSSFSSAAELEVKGPIFSTGTKAAVRVYDQRNSSHMMIYRQDNNTIFRDSNLKGVLQIDGASGKLLARRGVQFGDQSSIQKCGLGASNGEGTQRYNFENHKMEYCNGSGWVATNSPDPDLDLTPSGVFCGYYNNNHKGAYAFCKGHNPYFSCPAGYLRLPITHQANVDGQIFGGSNTGTLYLTFNPVISWVCSRL